MNKIIASFLTEEQIQEAKRIQRKQKYIYQKNWLVSQGEEKINEYKEKAKVYRKQCMTKICDICAVECKNIYTHRNSKKHIQRANNKENNIVNN